MPSSCGSDRSANSANPAIVSTSSVAIDHDRHGARCVGSPWKVTRTVDGPRGRAAQHGREASPKEPHDPDPRPQDGPRCRRPVVRRRRRRGHGPDRRGRGRGRVPGGPRHRPPGRDRDGLLRHRVGRGPGGPRRQRASRGSARASSSASCPCSTGGRASPRSSPTRRRPASPSRPGTSRPSSWREPRVALAILRELARPPARPDRSRPTLTAQPGARGADDPPSRSRAARSPSCSPTSRARRASSGGRTRALRRAARTAPGAPPGRLCDGPRRRGAGHRGRLVLRRVPRGADGRRGGGRRASGRWPPSRGRTTRRSGSGWASTRARRRADRRAARRASTINRAARIAAVGPRRPDPGRPGRPRPCVDRRPRPPASRCATSASIGSGTCASRTASARSSPTACRSSSRRSGRSTPGRTTCPPSSRRSSAATRELDEAAGLLATTRLLTLTGPGRDRQDPPVAPARDAVGRRISPTASSSSPLEPVRDPILVAPRIAAAVGIVESGIGRPIAELLAELAGATSGVLLVLDNFEQVVAAGPGRRRPAPRRARTSRSSSPAGRCCTSRASRSTRSRACRPRRIRAS